MPKKRKADVFAGQGSIAGALRKRREAVESGNLEGAAKAYQQGLKPEKPKKK